MVDIKNLKKHVHRYNTTRNTTKCSYVILEKLEARLELLFKQQFSMYKYHNTYFYNTFLPTHISTTLRQLYWKFPTKRTIGHKFDKHIKVSLIRPT